MPNKTVLKFKKELYPKEAVIKAAYHFIDKSYLHVDYSDGDYIIEIISKNEKNDDSIALEFENELLAQAVRYQVYTQTHTIREILMARAMSSTITGSNSALERSVSSENVDNLESILTDWFEKNEK